MTIDSQAPAGASSMYVQPSKGRPMLLGSHLLFACQGTCAGRAGLGASVNSVSPSDHPFEYEVIGEHLIDPMRLLAIDTEGRLFDLNLIDCSTSPAELTSDWVVDTVDTSVYHRRSTGVRMHPQTLVVG